MTKEETYQERLTRHTSTQQHKVREQEASKERGVSAPKGPYGPSCCPQEAVQLSAGCQPLAHNETHEIGSCHIQSMCVLEER